MATDVHPGVAAIAGLVGTWRGEGAGRYPTVAAFSYGEEITFSATPKPYLAYRSRTWLLPDNSPAHAEVGYWRCPGDDGAIEAVLTHPFGIVEVQEGRIDGATITLTSKTLAATSTAKEVTRIERRFLLEGNRLSYQVAMAAVGLPLTAHLTAELRRVA